MDAGARERSDAVRVVLVTVPDAETGRALARHLVEDRLVACGNVIPGVQSVYRWAGEVQEDSEAMVLFKTTEGAIQEMEKRVLDLHPYEVPEFLVLPVTQGSTPYLRWLRGEVASSDMSE